MGWEHEGKQASKPNGKDAETKRRPRTRWILELPTSCK